ncbi:LPS assembly lipoprotein LptE [Arundinibacter roseus]|uniref:LptE family protein n=1 Tax=Arundinibacter roseus TaxID=2070510 RepID=A0A4R4KGQ1_9BACT|nr:LptE family protein [Arundinibacter roseus]TDB66903.1 hypothetical protein EZE20_07195 [Arundinibacter roseus]
MTLKSKSKKALVLAIGWVFCCLMITGCGVYSFTGTNLSSDIKTFTVLNFSTGVAGGPSNLPLQVNEKIKEYFQRNTSLTLLPNGGDLILEGTLTGYDVVPVAPTANDQAGFNRLNVTVQVRFTNTKDETKNFDQSFSFYADFPQDQTLDQNEARLLPTILDQIVQNIFNKSAADW